MKSTDFAPMALTGPTVAVCPCTHGYRRHDLFGCTAPNCGCSTQGEK